METEFVKVHKCLTDAKARPGPVVIMNTPWSDKHGTRHADLVAHNADCKNARTR